MERELPERALGRARLGSPEFQRDDGPHRDDDCEDARHREREPSRPAAGRSRVGGGHDRLCCDGIPIRLHGAGRRVGDLFDVCDPGDELVATPGDGHDVGMLVRALVQGPAQRRNVPGQRGVFHGDVAPDAPHELVFLDDAAARLDQCRENFEGLRRERDDGAPAPKQSFAAVGHERTELITAAASGLGGHRVSADAGARKTCRTVVDFRNFHNSSGGTRDSPNAEDYAPPH